MKRDEFDQILEELEKMDQNQEKVLAMSQEDVAKAQAEAAMAQEIADNLAKKFEEEERKSALIKEKIEKARAAYEDVKKALAEEDDVVAAVTGSDEKSDSKVAVVATDDLDVEKEKNEEVTDAKSDENSDSKVTVIVTDKVDSTTEDEKKEETTDAKSDENSDSKVTVIDPIYVETKDDESDSETKKSGNTTKRIVTAIGAIVIISLASFVGCELIKDAKGGKVKEDNSKDPDKSMSDSLLEDTNKPNTPIIYEDEPNTFSLEEALTSKFEPLTYENFEKLMGDYVTLYKDEYKDVVSTEDLVKFGAIANIDLMVEDDKELASQLFGAQAKEEYLNDAAKIIGATVMYNFIEWNNFASTENFIRVSDIIYGEQKEKMLKIEEYTDRIAEAANKDDAELVNEIVSEFLTDMNSGSLSKLDDGVGFAAQVNIAVIADGIARNYLNQENFDMFQILKTSEKYVSNIFRVYEGCKTDSNVKTLTK